MTSETRTDVVNDTTDAATRARGPTSGATVVALAWLAVGIPLLWGVVQTLRRSLALFG